MDSFLFVWLRLKGYYQYLLHSSIIKSKSKYKIYSLEKGHRNINVAAKECAEREATIVRKRCSIKRGLLSKGMTPTQISFQLLKVSLKSFSLLKSN